MGPIWQHVCPNDHITFLPIHAADVAIDNFQVHRDTLPEMQRPSSKHKTRMVLTDDMLSYKMFLFFLISCVSALF